VSGIELLCRLDRRYPRVVDRDVDAAELLAGHGNTVALSADKERIDYEAELGVVIGKQCRNVGEDAAMDVFLRIISIGIGCSSHKTR
jgi:RNA 3'-terminal phosphate cyclase